VIEILIGSILALVSAADGDTLTLRDETERVVVRLAEIDAPEMTQPFSRMSRWNLEQLCSGAREIELERIDIDRFGRTVAHVWCDGVHINWRQVSDGLAWCFPRYPKHPEVCLPLERDAREHKRGMWRDAAPTSPWDFREMRRRPA